MLGFSLESNMKFNEITTTPEYDAPYYDKDHCTEMVFEKEKKIH